MLKEILTSHRLFLVGGPGGVGKTTLAATLAIQCAKLGHPTLVLTVDPAKRLAQALGFEGFKKDIQTVPLPEVSGTLSASMLDTERYFDKIIARFATHPRQKEKILGHPIYQSMVRTLGGTQEYAAMERLLEISQMKEYEKVIVDTPPTHNAVDLFTAPKRLADFMDNSVLRWFQDKSPGYLQFFRHGSRLVMKFFHTLFGAEFLEQFAELMNDLEGMQAGFRQRHLEVIELLQKPDTAFLLVSRPTQQRYYETESFLKILEDQNLRLKGILLNQVEPAVPKVPTVTPSETGLLEFYQALHSNQKHWENFFSHLAPEVAHICIPKQQGPLHQLPTLTQLGDSLVY